MKKKESIKHLTDIVAFARMVTYGTVGDAAQGLSVTPSAVHRTILRVEQQLGMTLCTHATGSLVLTKEGRELYDRAKRLIEADQRIVQFAAAVRDRGRRSDAES